MPVVIDSSGAYARGVEAGRRGSALGSLLGGFSSGFGDAQDSQMRREQFEAKKQQVEQEQQQLDQGRRMATDDVTAAVGEGLFPENDPRIEKYHRKIAGAKSPRDTEGVQNELDDLRFERSKMETQLEESQVGWLESGLGQSYVDSLANKVRGGGLSFPQAETRAKGRIKQLVERDETAMTPQDLMKEPGYGERALQNTQDTKSRTPAEMVAYEDPSLKPKKAGEILTIDKAEKIVALLRKMYGQPPQSPMSPEEYLSMAMEVAIELGYADN